MTAVAGIRLTRDKDGSVSIGIEYRTGYVHSLATVSPDMGSHWVQWEVVESVVAKARRAAQYQDRKTS